MQRSFNIALNTTWVVLFAYWIISARRVKVTSRREATSTQLFRYGLPLVVAALLMGPGEWFAGSILRERFVPHGTASEAVGLALTMIGALIAIWARSILGSNWSGTVQVKEGHELIQRGPYSKVRHPIYSGLILAFLGTAIAIGDWRGLLSVGLLVISLWLKLKVEERLMTETFGPVYRHYMLRTKALIPGVL